MKTKKIKNLTKKMELIISKVDDLFLRDIRAATKMLSDLSTDTHNINFELLTKTEDLFLKNIGLNPNLKTGSTNNTYIIAISYLGLFRIGIIKKYDDSILSRYILRMFETGEHFIRKDIFPEVYDSYFRKKCADVIAKHQKRKKNFAKPTDYIKAGSVRAQQVGAGILGGIVALGGTALKIPPSPTIKGTQETIRSLENSLLLTYRKADAEGIN